MSKDFEQSGHKNLELLRFYLSKDINKIDKKIQANNSDTIGYFIASLVDILIVLVFDDYLKCVSLWKKILCILGLVALFILVSKVAIFFSKCIRNRSKESGKELYVDESIQEVIDNFDNIACDGLLICENYIQKYNQANKPHVKDFYLYEIIHYLKKMSDIFRIIYSRKDLYISSLNKELIDVYRVNNFILFSQEINCFLQDNISMPSGMHDLDKDLTNLNEEISKWKVISQENPQSS